MPLMKNSKTTYALLGWLSTGPMSGYDLKRLTDRYIGQFWAGSFGQIYPLLHDMLDVGWVTMHEERTGSNPAKKVYTITETGRREFVAWFSTPVEPDVARSELLLRIFFGSFAPPENLIECLEGLLKDSRAKLALYESMREEFPKQYAHLPNLPYIMITLDRGFVVHQGFVEWAERALKTLKNIASNDHPQ